MFEAALEISRARQRILADLRVALESGDNQRAIELARQIVGLEVATQ